MMIKRIFFWLVAVFFIFIIGGAGGVLFDRYIFPELATLPGFSEISFLKKATDRVTVINKTEQVVIREDDTVERIVSQPATAVVNIVAVSGAVGGAKEARTMTGVLLTNDGLIATYSEQPFSGAETRYTVLLFDGSSHEASFAGRDPLTSLDYFRLNGPVNTPAIALANSDDARVGKKLIAIGNTSAEYQNRLSVGILGHINRTFNLAGKTVSSSEKWEGVLETDLPGLENFVGGPVIGFNGEMVGMAGMLTFDNDSYAFLLPSNVVRESLARAIDGTLATRPALGIYYLPITKVFALSRGLARDRGALIYSPSGKTGLSIIAGSPAMRAGLQVNDIIVAVNGREIDLNNPLPEILSRFNKGDQIELLILRNGEERKMTVTL